MNHSYLRAGLGIAAFLLAAGWVVTASGIFSAQHVSEQWGFAYRYEEALKSQARQVCHAREALALATDPPEQQQRRSQLLAMQSNYERVAQEFDARLRNAFEARLVAPPDVERSAPTFSQMEQRVCAR